MLHRSDSGRVRSGERTGVLPSARVSRRRNPDERQWEGSDSHADLPNPPTTYLKKIYFDSVVFRHISLKHSFRISEPITWSWERISRSTCSNAIPSDTSLRLPALTNEPVAHSRGKAQRHSSDSSQ